MCQLSATDWPLLLVNADPPRYDGAASYSRIAQPNCKTKPNTRGPDGGREVISSSCLLFYFWGLKVPQHLVSKPPSCSLYLASLCHPLRFHNRSPIFPRGCLFSSLLPPPYNKVGNKHHHKQQQQPEQMLSHLKPASSILPTDSPSQEVLLGSL